MRSRLGRFPALRRISRYPAAAFMGESMSAAHANLEKMSMATSAYFWALPLYSTSGMTITSATQRLSRPSLYILPVYFGGFRKTWRLLWCAKK